MTMPKYPEWTIFDSDRQPKPPVTVEGTIANAKARIREIEAQLAGHDSLRKELEKLRAMVAALEKL